MPRETKEEFEFGDFNVFTGGQEAFGTLNFCYRTEDFDRLSQLTEYNTRVHLDLIREEILRAIRAKQLTSKMSLKDIVRMKIMSRKSKDDFISLVRQLQEGVGSAASVPHIQRPSSGTGAAGTEGEDGSGFLPPPLERFVSATDLEPAGQGSDGGLRPHRPAERFHSAEDTADLPRPGAETSP